MSGIVVNELKKYMESLTATNTICDELGTLFASGTNLFIGYEPSNDVSDECMTLIPYSGTPPSPEGDRQESYVQIRLKTNDIEVGLKTMQSVINTLHNNTDACASCNGRIVAIQSSPILLEFIEGGEYAAFVANFGIKHTKLD